MEPVVDPVPGVVVTVGDDIGQPRVLTQRRAVPRWLRELANDCSTWTGMGASAS